MSPVPGQGLALLNIHPADQGLYICHAGNRGGQISASAMLRVLEPPVITVKPLAHSQVPAGRSIRLDCLVAGSPSPAVYWTREEGRVVWWLTGPPSETPSEKVVLADNTTTNNSSSNSNTTSFTNNYNNNNNVYMARNRSLIIVNATRANSGHYFCVGVNTAGAAMERSHILVYDEQDFVRNKSASEDQYYHVVPDPDLAAARAALLERTVSVSGLYADSPTSLRISWRLDAAAGSQQQQYLEGYYIYYRETSPTSATGTSSRTTSHTRQQSQPAVLASIKVLHAGATSYSLNRLRVHSEYEVFIAPFYKSVLGLPSASRLARTSEDWPSAAPAITNITAGSQFLGVSWQPLEAEAANGVLAGYRLRIMLAGSAGDPAATTLVVSPAETAAKIDIKSLQLPTGVQTASQGLVTLSVEVAALNSVGQGPFSPPERLQVDLARLLLLRQQEGARGGLSSLSAREEEENEDDYTQGVALDASPGWLGALIGSAFLVVFLIGGAVLTYRRQQQRAAKGAPPPANGLHHHHHHHHLDYLEKKFSTTGRDSQRGGMAAAESGKEQQLPHSASLWIDRRWTSEDCPTGLGCGGNSLDRRLLGGGNASGPCCAAENEYTYIDRSKLASFAGQNRAGQRTDGPDGGGGRDHLDLAPYASTDILRDETRGGSAYYSTRYLVGRNLYCDRYLVGRILYCD